MLQFTTQTDPETSRPVTTSLDRFFVSLLNDPRDLPFIYLGLRVTFTLIPMAVLLYMPFVPSWLWWMIAVVYLFINNITYKGPFGLMLHCTTHRRFFKKEYEFLNHYLPWVLAPFFGQSPETYRAHHVGMHHAENNLEPDESSTMPDARGVIHTDWAVHEVLTTANFARNNSLLNWYIGGLNFQIEHHLFPHICHIHYRKISPIVERTAKEFGIPYNLKPSLRAALASHVRRLRELGRPKLIPIPVRK